MGRWHLLVIAASGGLLFIVAVSACGETATIDGIDGAAPDGGGSSSGETSTSSDASGSVDGNGTADGATAGDGSTTDGAACGCKPDFCGCGECKRDQIICTKTPIACPLGCASSCDMSNIQCGCLGDRCVSVTTPPEKVPCYTTLDCPPAECCKKNTNERAGVCVAGNGC